MLRLQTGRSRLLRYRNFIRRNLVFFQANCFYVYSMPFVSIQAFRNWNGVTLGRNRCCIAQQIGLQSGLVGYRIVGLILDTLSHFNCFLCAFKEAERCTSGVYRFSSLSPCSSLS